MNLQILVIAASFLAPAATSAQALSGVPLDYLPALKGDYFAIDSRAVNHRYHIYLRYPEGYDPNSSRRYPVVYLLDGDSTFPILAASHLFLTYDDKLPEAIVVGISYGSFTSPVNRRDIDFGEGAQRFQNFLATELIPKVEQRVRADPAKRILVGQSFGGSFVLYSAYTRPDLFWARIASNPSFRMHQQLLASQPSDGTRSDLHLLLVSGTANNPPGRQGALGLTRQLGKRKLPWKYDQIDIEGGTHAADIGNAYRLALRRLFTPAN